MAAFHLKKNCGSLVASYTTPKNLKETRSFIGLTNYFREFIPHYATKIIPVHVVTAFRQLKEEFGKIEHDFLFLLSKGTQLVLKRDASETATSGVLFTTTLEAEILVTLDDEATLFKEQTKICSFTSHIFSKTERNYTVIKKELLSLIFSIKHFETVI
jgi:RNase H-like domain found in reverse transcriptase